MHLSAHRSPLTLALLVALTLAGCPSDPAVPADVPLAELPTHLARALCSTYDSCNPLARLAYGATADCTAMLAARFSDAELGGYEDAVDAGTIAYHGDLVDDCITLLAVQGCDIRDPLEVCEGIFEGLVTDGGACQRNEECGASSYCAITASCPGTCQARVASGGTCGASGSCAAGLECQSGTCRAPAGDGAACNGTTGVACSGLAYACVGDDGATPGVCTPWPELFSGAVGEMCDPRIEDFCNDGLACAFDGLAGGMPTFRCTAPVASGASCTIAIPDQCPAGEFCSGVDLMTGATMGTCAPLPTAGQACTPALPFPRCAAGHLCVPGAGGTSMVCEPMGRIGASCASSSTCASDYCMGGRCVEGVPSACR